MDKLLGSGDGSGGGVSAAAAGAGGDGSSAARAKSPLRGVGATGRSNTVAKAVTDHVVSSTKRISPKDYPEDCPPVVARWHYAVDNPKRKPFQKEIDLKNPPKPAVKFVPFGEQDSRNIEAAFLELSERDDARTALEAEKPWTSRRKDGGDGDAGSTADRKEEEDVTVPVNEDYLFDVHIRKRELATAYWEGPVYSVLRGTWFRDEGSSLRPLEEKLSDQIERGYIKFKPYRQKSATAAVAAAVSAATDASKKPDVPASEPATAPSEPPVQGPSLSQQSWPLLGPWLNSFVIYVDATTAWLMTDDIYGKISSTLFQRITSGQNLGGVKLVRGWVDKSPATAAKDKIATATTTGSRPVTPTPGKGGSGSKRSSTIIDPKKGTSPKAGGKEEVQETPAQAGRMALERKMSNLLGMGDDDDPEKVMEDEMKQDYKNSDENENDRVVEHLILVTHGIGQRLSLRMESINFIHDVNVFRKTLKDVYGASSDIQHLNSQLENAPKNCRIQVLPVCWRHLLNFPKEALRANRLNSGYATSMAQAEHDLGNPDDDSVYDSYPALDDITVEGVPAVRSLITDLALDILLYQSAYREHIARIVVRESNRIYELWKKRNPGWNGRVSLCGHSLGSAIYFDILCREGFKGKQVGDGLKFRCDSFFAFGSPIGLFQMLEGKSIAARTPMSKVIMMDNDLYESVTTPPETRTDYFGPVEPPSGGVLDINISSPLCGQLYNIFHPTDPISYRMEPLVTKAMSEIKPQNLPYTKKTLLGNQLAGLTGIGQSITSLWSNFSAGVASSILNRSLGFTDVQAAASDKRKSASSLDIQTWYDEGEEMEHQPTQIDGELETLYAGFQKRRYSKVEEGGPGATGEGSKKVKAEGEEKTEGERRAEEKARRLKVEERKVRALNRTGRIDFAVQEGTFDISLIASIASHLSYWSDEDVNSFILSQLLSNRKKSGAVQKTPQSGA
ncbi:hypothetical protein TWF696_004207 [Orbilia brochopaga]|uniref:DDHD domain-containing protein n=1 Tax=Orbilia brochopaga TaxID=3140254 RepID=A0AAV9V5P5_9PEZI